jgi:uncharacterized protein (TIGR03089 family)
MTSQPPTVIAAFAMMTAADATKPLITYYDDATGERLDLSGATLANWVAKTANLLVDGHGLGPGDIVAVNLPPHWLTAAVMLGCWSAGVAISPTDGEVGFTTAALDVAATDIYAVSLAPLGAPFHPGPPAGSSDYAVSVRAYGDQFTPRVAGSDLALSDGTTHAELVSQARAVAAPRVLVDSARTGDVLDWLVAPIVHGASIVLCANLDPTRVDARLTSEHAVRWP